MFFENFLHLQLAVVQLTKWLICSVDLCLISNLGNWPLLNWPFVKLSFVKFGTVQHVFVQLTWIPFDMVRVNRFSQVSYITRKTLSRLKSAYSLLPHKLPSPHLHLAKVSHSTACSRLRSLHSCEHMGHLHSGHTKDPSTRSKQPRHTGGVNWKVWKENIPEM